MTAAVLWAFEAGFGRLLSAIEGGADPAAAFDQQTGWREPTIDGVRSLDPMSWQRLYLANRDDLYRYALGRFGSPADAEDVVGETFEEALKSAARLEDRGVPARAWLFGIARNVVNRRRRRLFQVPPQLSLDSLEAATDGALGLHLEMIDLARLVARLPASQAEVVMLRFVHGLSLEETAAVLNDEPSRIKARQMRALKKLRDWLGAPAATPARATLPARPPDA